MSYNRLRKTAKYKKLLQFLDFDLCDQLPVLIKVFVPLLIIGGIVQYCLHHYCDYNKNIIGIIIGFFVIIVVFIIRPEEKMQIVNKKDENTKIWKFLLNILLGIIYFGCATFCSAMLLYYGGQLIGTDENEIFCFRFIGGILLFIFTLWLILWKFNDRLFLKLPETIIKKIHYMEIENKDFSLIETKQKKLEVRLADNKRRKIKIGDILIFHNLDNIEKHIVTEVTKLYFASDLAELLSQIDLPETKHRYIHDNTDSLNNIYTSEQQKKRGVMGIEFELIEH